MQHRRKKNPDICSIKRNKVLPPEDWTVSAGVSAGPVMKLGGDQGNGVMEKLCYEDVPHLKTRKFLF